MQIRGEAGNGDGEHQQAQKHTDFVAFDPSDDVLGT